MEAGSFWENAALDRLQPEAPPTATADRDVRRKRRDSSRKPESCHDASYLYSSPDANGAINSAAVLLDDAVHADAAHVSLVCCCARSAGGTEVTSHGAAPKTNLE